MKKLGKVMLIDDDYFTNLYNEAILMNSDIADEILIFDNAFNAKEYLRLSSEKVNVIFLDLHMPIMDGWKFIEKLEDLKLEYKEIPDIVVLTAESINNDLISSTRNSTLIKKYIQKPLTSEMVDELANVI